jgi:hypothetical protein
MANLAGLEAVLKPHGIESMAKLNTFHPSSLGAMVNSWR